MKILKGWRKLRLGTRLRKGDRYWDMDAWIATGWKPGTVLTADCEKVNGPYIRRYNR